MTGLKKILTSLAYPLFNAKYVIQKENYLTQKKNIPRTKGLFKYKFVYLHFKLG